MQSLSHCIQFYQDKDWFLSYGKAEILKRNGQHHNRDSPMQAENVKVELENLEIHMGEFRGSKLKIKGNATYEDLMLVMDGGKTIVRLHARNIGNVHLEKKGIRIAAMNFEINQEGEISTATGSIRIELGNEAEAWYKELWG